MTNYKSKKFKQHDNIKLGIAAVFAVAIIVIIVLIVNSKSIDAQVTFSRTPYTGVRCVMAEPNPHLTQVNCEADGFQQCKRLNPPFEYPISSGDICYKHCQIYVKQVCKNAPKRYPFLT